MNDTISILRRIGIKPTPQRLAVADFILRSRAHPSADEVLEQVKRECPTISRATVYNTLNLMTRKGLLKARVIREGTIVFDSSIEPHHHLIDEDSGRIYDIPWQSLEVTVKKPLKDFRVSEFQVVIWGKKVGR